MKASAFVPFVLLAGCVSTTDVSEEQRYRTWVGQAAHLDREMTLHEAKTHQFTFTPYVLSRGKFSGVAPEKDPIGRVVAVISAGAEIRVLAFKRERGVDGHVWDFLLGELRVAPEAAPVSFEYLIGLADKRRALPLSAK